MRILFLILFPILSFGQQKYTFVQGQGWRWVNASADSATFAQTLALKANTTDITTSVNTAISTATFTFASLTSKPTTLLGYGIIDAAALVHTHTFASITSPPTTKAGYGIIDVPGLVTGATAATTGAQTVTLTGSSSVFTITPSGACTFNASGGQAGARVTFIFTTSGTSSFVMTFGTNFKSVGTLSTGTTTAKVFAVNFICKDGTLWVETGRTAAQ